MQVFFRIEGGAILHYMGNDLRQSAANVIGSKMYFKIRFMSTHARSFAYNP